MLVIKQLETESLIAYLLLAFPLLPWDEIAKSAMVDMGPSPLDFPDTRSVRNKSLLLINYQSQVFCFDDTK
jgi:hypothetical protein